MTDNAHTISRRARTVVGVAFVALAMVAASALAGLGSASSAPSAAQYQYGKKVAICHYTGSKRKPWVTLHIDLHAWPGHLKHGDVLGPCGKNPPPVPTHHHGAPTPKHGQGNGSNGGSGHNK
jgi:hypothetical protein